MIFEEIFSGCGKVPARTLRQIVVAENGMTLNSSSSFSRIKASSGRESKFDTRSACSSFDCLSVFVLDGAV